MRQVNVLAPTFDHACERDGYRWRGARVGPAIGAEQIGGCLYELGDAQRSYPYHFHHGLEEWLVVVAGAPSVRTPAGVQVLRQGDVLCFPVGPDGAHQVIGPGTVLMVSEERGPDSVEFPDSGKVGLLPSGTTFRSGDAVDYWDGE